MKTYDAIIIGFGKGGKTLAVELARNGWSVAMIERSDKMYGGTCINIVALAMKHGITARELSGSIYTHPGMSESLNDLFA